LFLSGIELRFLGCAVRNLVTTATVLTRLHLHFICNLNILTTLTGKRAQSHLQVGLYLTQRTDNAQRLLSNKIVALLQKERTVNKYLWWC